MPSRPARAIVEVRVIPPSPTCTPSSLREQVHKTVSDLLRDQASLYLSHTDLSSAVRAKLPYVRSASLTIGDDSDKAVSTMLLEARLVTHVYACYGDEKVSPEKSCSSSSATQASSDEGSLDDGNEDGDGAEGDDDVRDDLARELTDVATVIELPCAGLDCAWERLHFSEGLKDSVLGYIRAGWCLGKRQVDTELVGWNGMILLHGPPGTGKTSLCRALAHKSAIRMDANDGVLVEVRMERMLSKYFSESSTRVRSVFDRVVKLAKKRSFVTVMLDEVETVGLSRKGRSDGSEPGDAIRVVNALLGGIDGIREMSNVIVVATSNLMDGIDEALLDRADMRVFIGEPLLKARVSILEGVVKELKDKGVISGDEDRDKDVESVARVCEGLSGRAIRKVAFVAMGVLGVCEEDMPVHWKAFANAMTEAAKGMHVGMEKKKDDDGLHFG